MHQFRARGIGWSARLAVVAAGLAAPSWLVAEAPHALSLAQTNTRAPIAYPPRPDLHIVSTIETEAAKIPPASELEAIPLPKVVDRAPASALSVLDLEALALANNPTLAQAAGRVQAARGRSLQAGLYPNPTISYVGSEIGNGGTAGQQGAAISQEIVTSGKLGLSRAVANRELAQAQAQFEAQRWRVLSDVRIEFYNVLVAQRTMELSDELTVIGRRGVETAETLLRAQEVGRSDLLQARIEASTAAIAATNAKNRYESAWRRLAAASGLSQMAPTPLGGNPEEAIRDWRWEDVVARMTACSPEVLVARAGVARAQAALELAIAERRPNVTVEAAAQHDNSSGDDIANLSIGLPIPIHNRNQGNIRQAEADLRVAQSEVARVQLDLQNRLAAVFERYANARNVVRQYGKEILPAANDTLDLVGKSYRAGESSYLNVLTAQRTFSQANLAYLAALRDLWESTVAIEGYLLTDSLSQSGDR